MIAIMSPACTAPLLQLVERDLHLRERQVLFRTGDAVRFLYFVRSGCVRLERTQASGEALVLQRATAGQLAAEASVFAPRYHCNAVAAGPTLVGRIARKDVDALQQRDPAWLRAFASHLAGEVQRTRARAELLSHKRVDARLDAWLTLHGGSLPGKGRWVELAAELAVTPEALYRELSRRRLSPART